MRGAGAGEGRGDLAADMAGFAHAHHHHFAAAGGDRFAGAGEVCVDVAVELSQPFTLYLKHFFAGLLKIEARLQLNVRHTHSRRFSRKY